MQLLFLRSSISTNGEDLQAAVYTGHDSDSDDCALCRDSLVQEPYCSAIPAGMV